LKLFVDLRGPSERAAGGRQNIDGCRYVHSLSDSTKKKRKRKKKGTKIKKGKNHKTNKIIRFKNDKKLKIK
jgi:hypothetical protein